MRRNNNYDPPVASDENWIWGNTRGGGGAPLRNPNGEPVANLRGVMNGTVEVDYNSPGRKGTYRDSPGRRGGNDADDRRYHSPIKGSEYTATRGMGHKNMNIDDQERENRARKAREYQEQLREQVEEKKRKKEAEQREVEQTKQREYNDYIKNHYKGPPVSGKDGYPDRMNRGGHGRGSEDDEPPRDSRKKDDSNHREKFRRNDYDDHERDRNRDRDYRDRGDNNARGGRDERERDRDQPRYPNDRNQGRDGRRGGSDKHDRGSCDSGEESDYRSDARWVSRREFDDLQRDYDQLKLEHEELANQLMLQEEIIEDLRRNQAKQEVIGSKPARGIALSGKKGAKAGVGPAPTGRDKKKIALAEHDVVSDPGIKPRAQSTRNAVGGVKLPVVNKKSRPSSMHDTPKESAPSRNKPEKRVAGAAKGSEVSGFKKLQMGIESKRGGPVVVSFEEEEELKGKQISPVPPAAGRLGGGARQSHLPVSKARGSQDSSVQELRGASEHFSIPSTDMDGISNDQLDRLLMKARNARN